MSSLEYRQPVLSWTERPMAELIRLAWPIAVTALSYSAMTLVDTIYVAGLGRGPLAAVGLGGVAAFTFLCFSMGLLRGVKILVSQAVGAGHEAEAGRYTAAGLFLALGLGVVTTVVGVIVSPLVADLASSPETGALAGHYLVIRIVSAPVLLVYVALRESRYGLSDARSPMLAAVSANLLNILLDYVFIILLDGGVAGAAWATVAGVVFECAVLLYVAGREPWRQLGRGRAHVASVWRVGVPTGVQFLLEVGSFSLLSAIIAGMTPVQMAAHQLAIQALHFSFLPAWALAEAGSVLAGQAVGAERDDLVRAVGVRALLLAAIYTGFCTLLFVVIAPRALAASLDDPQLVQVTASLLAVAAIFQVADGANVVARGILRGTGDVRFPAVIGIVTAWVCVPPLAWFFGVRLGMGALGGWIGLCLEIFVGAALFWWRLWRGHWMKAAEITRAEVRSRSLADAAAGV